MLNFYWSAYKQTGCQAEAPTEAVSGGGAVRGAVAVAETVAVAEAVAATLQSAVDSPQSADSSRRCRRPTARQAARLAVWRSGSLPVIW